MWRQHARTELMSIALRISATYSSPPHINATVKLELNRLDGTPTGLAETLTLPANAQLATFLDEIQGFDVLSMPFQGVLRVASTASISVAGFRTRYNESAEFLFATLPAVNEDSPVSITPRYLTQLADGGGYATQFVIFSGQSDQASSGTLRLFTQQGEPLNVLVPPTQ